VVRTRTIVASNSSMTSSNAFGGKIGVTVNVATSPLQHRVGGIQGQDDTTEEFIGDAFPLNGFGFARDSGRGYGHCHEAPFA
jgi:hypothetical protein